MIMSILYFNVFFIVLLVIFFSFSYLVFDEIPLEEEDPRIAGMFLFSMIANFGCWKKVKDG
jgi:hypothetical protein